MAYRPNVGDTLEIEGVLYSIAEHPFAPGVPYGQEGRAALVYQLKAGEEKRALKVFKPRYQVPSMVILAERLEPLAKLPGLKVCHRTVLTARRHIQLVREHPDLGYAVLMPWIEGPTWMEVLLFKREFTKEQSLSVAHGFVEVLASMEERGLAHCDLSGPNMLLPMLAVGGNGNDPTAAGNTPVSRAQHSQFAVELVDVEQMYGEDLKRPEVLPGGSGGYAHRTAPEGLWSAVADRFAGAMLISEMLGWYDSRVRDAAWGESYFDPQEMQTPGARYDLMIDVLREGWGDSVAGLLERAWHSDTLADCPTFGRWLTVLPDPPTVGTVGTVAQAQGDGSGAGASQISGVNGPEVAGRKDESVQGQSYAPPSAVTLPQAPAYVPPVAPQSPAYQPSPGYGPPATSQATPQPIVPPAASYQQAHQPGPVAAHAAPPRKRGGAGRVIVPLLLLGLLLVFGGAAFLLLQGLAGSRAGAQATATATVAVAARATDTIEVAREAQPTTTPGDEVASGEPTATLQSGVIERSLPGAEERSVTYANLHFSIDQAVITTRTEEGEYPPEPGKARLKMVFSVENPTTDGVYVSSALLQLRLGDGTTYRKPVNIGISPRDTQEFDVTFDVSSNATWDGASIHFDEVDKEPVEMPLSGPTPTPQYPIALSAEGEVSLKDPQVTYKLLGGTIDLDARGKRAEIGMRYLILKVQLSSNEQYGALINSTNFRLIADGKTIAVDSLSPNSVALYILQEEEFEAVFLVSNEVSEVELEVGELGKEAGKIPMSLSDHRR